MEITRLCDGCGCEATAGLTIVSDWLVCCGDYNCKDKARGSTKEEAISNWNNKESTR